MEGGDTLHGRHGEGHAHKVRTWRYNRPLAFLMIGVVCKKLLNEHRYASLTVAQRDSPSQA